MEKKINNAIGVLGGLAFIALVPVFICRVWASTEFWQEALEDAAMTCLIIVLFAKFFYEPTKEK